MDTIYIWATTSFILGSFSYIIMKFFIIPIIKYKKIKREIFSSIFNYLNTINDDRSDSRIQTKIDECVNNMRQLSDDLAECHDIVIPVWYRLLLLKRGESPEIASEHMNILYNTRDYERAKNRKEKILEALKI